MSHGTATATVGNTNTATAARYAPAASTGLLPRPDSRRTRNTVLGPPAASAPDGARPDAQVTNARARGVRPVARTAASSREQLHEQLHRAQRVGAADQPRKSGMRGGERLQNQVVTRTQMGPLVGEDGGDFCVGKVVQCSLADHDTTTHARQAVGQRLRDVQDLAGHASSRTTPPGPQRGRPRPDPRPSGGGPAGADWRLPRAPRPTSAGRRPARSTRRPRYRPPTSGHPGAADADDAGGGSPLRAGHQHPGGDRDSRAEGRKNGEERDGLPQHHRGARSAQRPRRAC